MATVLICQESSLLHAQSQVRIPIAYSQNDIKKTISYIGFIKFPPSYTNENLEKCPAPRIYYKGNVVTVSKTYDNDKTPLFNYACSSDTPLNSFDIVIALIGKPQSNTIASFEVPTAVGYVHYKLQAERSVEHKKGHEWVITETRSVGPYTIPTDALIISEDADLIKGIQLQPGWNKDNPSILLPTILYLNIEKELFQNAHNAALLASLDTDGFHKKEEWVILQSPKSRIFKTRIS
jgi:hypothetical protein